MARRWLTGVAAGVIEASLRYLPFAITGFAALCACERWPDAWTRIGARVVADHGTPVAGARICVVIGAGEPPGSLPAPFAEAGEVWSERYRDGRATDADGWAGRLAVPTDRPFFLTAHLPPDLYVCTRWRGDARDVVIELPPLPRVRGAFRGRPGIDVGQVRVRFLAQPPLPPSYPDLARREVPIPCPRGEFDHRLPPGRYRVAAEWPGGAGLLSVPVNLVLAMEVEFGVLDLPAGRPLRLRVVDAADGRPLPRAHAARNRWLTWERVSDRVDLGAEAVVEPGGVRRWTGEPRGWLRYRASCAGYETRDFWILNAGHETAELDFGDLALSRAD